MYLRLLIKVTGKRSTLEAVGATSMPRRRRKGRERRKRVKEEPEDPDPAPRKRAAVYRLDDIAIIFCPRISECTRSCTTYRKVSSELPATCVNASVYTPERLEEVAREARRMIRVAASIPYKLPSNARVKEIKGIDPTHS
jgi:hypothetical protein